MRLRDTAEDADFRARLRQWLVVAVRELPPVPARDDWSGRRTFDTSWQRRLFDAGYAGVSWPAEFGGGGATPSQQMIFLQETHRAHAPDIGVCFIGLAHAGPTLIARGTDQQKAAHLPKILRGEEIWCQGFSEPGAGSDLASLRTPARIEGDHYVVTGQKIWTSYAPVADYCELLVRTDPDAPAHKGITWLIMAMDSPGVTVRPLRTALGSTEYAELFLEEVRIPIANRVGDENAGWSVAMVTLEFERGTALLGELLTTAEILEIVVRTAQECGRWDDPIVRTRAGRSRADLGALWALASRNVSRTPGPRDVGGNVFKLAYTEARFRLDDLAAEVLGPRGLAFEATRAVSYDPVEERVRSFMFSIAGGTTQVQRNIVAERGLGMPR
jgi:alkylation response protein AidB-like acyl-CoA dehydrogenase